jgi:hypothetical protein
MKYNYNDGGRANYFKGNAGDCVTRAVAIATGFDYKEVYDTIKDLIQHTPRNGISKQETRDIMRYYGFTWVPLMTIGGGCRYHLNEDDLPTKGIIICQVSHHVTTIIDGVINDTFNPSRDGKRCVYGYWYIEEVA